jgi:hypothetical protein
VEQTYSAIKETYMKTMQIVALWTFGIGSIVPAQAFDILGMRSDPNTIQTATEASKLALSKLGRKSVSFPQHLFRIYSLRW